MKSILFKNALSLLAILSFVLLMVSCSSIPEIVKRKYNSGYYVSSHQFSPYKKLNLNKPIEKRISNYRFEQVDFERTSNFDTVVLVDNSKQIEYNYQLKEPKKNLVCFEQKNSCDSTYKSAKIDVKASVQMNNTVEKRTEPFSFTSFILFFLSLLILLGGAEVLILLKLALIISIIAFWFGIIGIIRRKKNHNKFKNSKLTLVISIIGLVAILTLAIYLRVSILLFDFGGNIFGGII